MYICCLCFFSITVSFTVIPLYVETMEMLFYIYKHRYIKHWKK